MAHTLHSHDALTLSHPQSHPSHRHSHHPPPSTTTSTTLSSIPHLLPHSSPPSLSLNVRFPGQSSVLLPQDIFVPSSETTLLSIFRQALSKHPEYLGRYILRRDKSVIVLCKDSSLSLYVNPTTSFASLLHRHPVRLIFCVFPNEQVIRALKYRQHFVLTLNVQVQAENVLTHDVVIDVGGGMNVMNVWQQLQREVSEIDGFRPTALWTKKEGIKVRFGMQDFVADFGDGGKRFVFEAERVPGELQQHQHQHHQHHQHQHAGQHQHVHGQYLPPPEQRRVHFEDDHSDHNEQQHAHLDEGKVSFKFKPFFRFKGDNILDGVKKVKWPFVQSE